MHKLVRLLLALATVLSVNAFAAGGRLDAFEKDARKNAAREARKRSASTSTHKHDNSHDRGSHSFFDDDDDDGFAESILTMAGFGLLYGGASSWQRVSPGDTEPLNVVPREHGAPLLPFTRIDAAYIDASDSVDALDLLTEVGYGPFAAQYALTRYEETGPDDRLDVYHVLGMFRLSYGPQVEVDFAMGALTLDGESTSHRFAFSLPVLIHPTEHLGVEIRPLWSDLADRYDVAGLLTWNHVSLKGGYRWLTGDHESLNGPYVGLSVRY